MIRALRRGIRRGWQGGWRGRLQLGLLALTALILASLLALAGASLWYWPQLPELDRVTNYQPRQPLQVFTQDGVEIAQFGSERRQFMAIEQTIASPKGRLDLADLFLGS